MASYAREFDARANEDLQGLRADVAIRIIQRLAELEGTPRPRGDTIKRPQGFSIPTYRFRVGDYRAVFRIAGTRVVILRIVHRSRLNRALRDLM